MQRFFNALGWILVIGGVAGGVASFLFVDSQEFVLSLLARLVERPFEYRTYLAALTGAGVLTQGCLLGAMYIGIGRILERTG